MEDFHTKLQNLEVANTELTESISFLNQQQSDFEKNLTLIQNSDLLSGLGSSPTDPSYLATGNNNPRNEMLNLLASLNEDITMLQHHLISLSGLSLAQTAPLLDYTGASPSEFSILDTLRANREAIHWIDEKTIKLAENLA